MKTSGKKSKTVSKRPTRKDSKNVSMKEIVSKTVDTIKEKIKKPFGGKGGRKGKAEIEKRQRAEAENRIMHAEQEYFSTD